MKGRIRWAILTALLSVVLAVALGVAALIYRDDEPAADTEVSIGGNYAFASTTIVTSVPSSAGLPSALSVTGGRLSIGDDSHAFWSLDMQAANNPSRPGRLSCEGTYNRATSTITLEPRFGFTGFPPEMDRREVQDQLYAMLCSAAGTSGQGRGTVRAQTIGALLELSGAGGTISWRRE